MQTISMLTTGRQTTSHLRLNTLGSNSSTNLLNYMSASTALTGKRSSAGFTVVELMIAVAILAIVSAIAVPIYTQYSENTYRSEAKADLLMCAQGMERFASENFTYEGADDGAGGLGTQICRPLSESRYAISVVATRDSFTLTATPKPGILDGDGELEYGSNGQRRWNKQGNGFVDNWEE